VPSMAHIMINGREVEVLYLQSEHFSKLLGEFTARPIFTDQYSFETYIAEKRDTETALRAAFSRFWKDPDDFEVASDQNVAFTMCGGIYSRALLCRAYLETLHGVLGSTRMRNKWVYSTSVEVPTQSGHMELYAFMLRGDTVYVEDDRPKFDFIDQFSTPMQPASNRH
jgi:hypothetical protein